MITRYIHTYKWGHMGW